MKITLDEFSSGLTPIIIILFAISVLALIAFPFIFEKFGEVLGAGVVLVVLGSFCGGIFLSIQESRAQENHVEDAFTAEYGVTELENQHRGQRGRPILSCGGSSSTADAIYKWTTKEGERVTGVLSRDFEHEGTCDYTLSPAK